MKDAFGQLRIAVRKLEADAVALAEEIGASASPRSRICRPGPAQAAGGRGACTTAHFSASARDRSRGARRAASPWSRPGRPAEGRAAFLLALRHLLRQLDDEIGVAPARCGIKHERDRTDDRQVVPSGAPVKVSMRRTGSARPSGPKPTTPRAPARIGIGEYHLRPRPSGLGRERAVIERGHRLPSARSRDNSGRCSMPGGGQSSAARNRSGAGHEIAHRRLARMEVLIPLR